MGDSIVIDTTLSTKGFERGSAALKSAIGSLSKSAKQMAASVNRIIPSIIGVGSAFQVVQKAVNSFMSQNDELSKRMDAVWTALGNLIGPIVEKVVGWVTTAVSYLLSFLKLLGITTKTAAKTSQQAQKNTTELKRTLAGFDELNVLQDNSSNSAGNGGGIPGLPDINPSEWMKAFADLIKSGMFGEAGRMLAARLNEIINGIDWAGLGQKIAYYFKGAIDFIGNVIRDFDAHNLGKKFATLVNQILNIDTSSEDTWKNLGEVLVAKFTLIFDLLTGFLEDLDASALAKAVSGTIIGALEAITDSIETANWKKIGENIGKFFTELDWDGIAKAMWDAFTAAFSAASGLYVGLPDWLQSVALGVIAVKTACEGLKALSTFTSFIESVKNLEGKGVLGQLGNVIATVASGAGTLKEAVEMALGETGAKLGGIGAVLIGATTAIKNFVDMITGGFSIMKEIFMLIGIAIAAVGATILGVAGTTAAIVGGIVAAAATVVVLIVNYADQIKDALNRFGDWLKNIFCRDWTEVFGVQLGSAINLAVGVIGGLLGGLKQILFGFMDIIQGVFTGNWKQAWDGLLGIVKGVINGIIGVVNGMLSAITNAVNAMCRLLSFNIDLPGGGSVGLSLPQFSTPQIPYLAEGGVLKKGQVGLLEGDGTEAVVPLEKNTEWINKVADAFLSRLSSGQYTIGGNAKALAALDSISGSVAFRAPAIASGCVTPYSVGSGGRASSTGVSGVDEELYAEIVRFHDDMMEVLNRLQFVADFGDNIRALARRITKEQKRNQISEGR